MGNESSKHVCLLCSTFDKESPPDVHRPPKLADPTRWNPVRRASGSGVVLYGSVKADRGTGFPMEVSFSMYEEDRHSIRPWPGDLRITFTDRAEVMHFLHQSLVDPHPHLPCPTDLIWMRDFLHGRRFDGTIVYMIYHSGDVDANGYYIPFEDRPRTSGARVEGSKCSQKQVSKETTRGPEEGSQRRFIAGQGGGEKERTKDITEQIA